jgi:hypothetical protein
MTLFFTTTLYLSIAGLVLLLGFKRYELRTNRVVFARIRPGLERFSHALVLFIQYILPFLARRSVGAMLRGFRATLSAALARALLQVEIFLARILAKLQHIMQPKRTGGAASTFLQEVAEHKRKLIRNPAHKSAIFEE